MKKYLTAVLCLLVIVLAGSNIYGIVKFNSYKEEQTHSLMTEIFHRASDVREGIQKMIDEEDYSPESMQETYTGFRALASLFKSDRNINYNAESDFHYIGASFLAGTHYSDPCYIEALFADEAITENEAAYMKKIIEIVDQTLQNVYNEKKDTFDIDILNENIQSVNELLHDPESSPYLLIQTQPAGAAS